MADPVRRRGAVKAKLTRFEDFVQNLADSVSAGDVLSQADVMQLRRRLVDANPLLNQFELIQLEVEAASEDLNSEYIVLQDFESKYYRVISSAEELLQRVTTVSAGLVENVNPRVSPPPSSVSSVNGDSVNSSVAGSVSGSKAFVKLPTINLPNFDGKPEEWLNFRDLFSSLIDTNEDLTDVHKLHYLRASLSGKASDAIKGLAITSANYRIAWKGLNDRFNNSRSLTYHHIKELFNLDNVSRESSNKLRSLVDSLKRNLRSLDSLMEKEHQREAFLIFLLQSKLDATTNREFENKINSDQVFSLDELVQFVEKKASLMETVEQRSQKPTHQSTSRSLVASGATSSCPLCGSAHALYSCNQFKKLSVEDRQAKARQLRVCLNCLAKGHFSRECKSSHKCRMCNSNHNSLLHSTATRNPEVTSADNQVISTQKSSDVSLSSFHATHTNVLLSTAIVNIQDAHGKVHRARVLLDSGSQSSFVTESLVERLGLKRYGNVEVSVMGLGKSVSRVNSRCMATLMSIHSAFKVNVPCLVIPVITGVLPSTDVNVSHLSIPANLKLADPEFDRPNDIDILIGAALFYDLLCVGRISLGKNQPMLQETRFGWVVSGNAGSPSVSTLQVNCSFASCIPNVQDQIARFWELEETPSSKAMSVEELECETHFRDTFTRDASGRFVVSIPFRENLNALGDSLDQAKRRFYNLERRLNTSPALREKYVEFMSDYERLGHMSVIPASETPEASFYLPHHGVLKESSVTTKLRVVFDGSARTSSGVSLNDTQRVGPVIQSDLFSILIRFRKYVYVFSTDIEKMYRQVLITKDQRPMQRILWRPSPEVPLSTYELNTITYGTASASFLATRCLFEVGAECASFNPELARVIQRDFYVDDCLSGSNSLVDLQKTCSVLSEVLSSYGFPLRKWLSNDPKVLKKIEASDIHPSLLDFGSSAKTLGLLWSGHSDDLLFSISQQSSNSVTKRTMLSDIAQIFDPLGLLSPCTMNAKFMLQALWLAGISWDDPIPQTLLKNWLSFRSSLPELNEVRFSRNVICENPKSVALHAFSDASTKGYGACIYIRSVDQNDQIHCHLLCSKGKVAPLKCVSIPGMELCGAVVLAHLVKHVTLALDMAIDSLTFWTDSTIVLSWLKIPPNRLKTFVANRVSEIQELSKDACWRHVPSSSNPADLISRGALPYDLINSDLWSSGPWWLRLPETHWPSSVFDHPDVPELKCEISVNSSIDVDKFPIARFSELSRLKRVVAFCLRFGLNCSRPKCDRQVGAPSLAELNAAMLALIRIAQLESFADELKLLKAGRPTKSSRLASLNPFIDQHGLIRVGGRIRNSSYSFEKRHPLIVDGGHPLARLIVVFEHIRLLHAGPQLLLSSIREKYWITSGRNLCKGVVHSCVRCFRLAPKTTNPVMGDLPNCRVERSFPFQNTGVDYAGPLLLKDRKGRGNRVTKCYICLFVCLATKAIHLELVSDLSSEAFIQALRRFVARRGRPSHIFSDNGTNFIGAKSALHELGKFLKRTEQSVSDFATENEIVWHFIPGHSPHFGGLWEAGVKSCKHHLKRVAGNASLTFEEFCTLLAQIESVLNSRPLTPLSSDPSDFEPLTPGHFLIGRPMMSVVDADVTLTPQTRLSRFRFVQQMSQHFWARWSREYVSELQQRTKWQHQLSDLKLDTLVLIKHDNLPPLKWQLGRILQLHPGKDGVNRVATIKTANGVLRRSFSKICPLPIEENSV